jgi:hypothetical protein
VPSGQPWIARQWLAECALALLHRMSGLDGILLGTATLLASFYTWLARRLMRAGIHWLLTVLIVIFAFRASSYHFYPRPHLVTIVLLGCLFGLLSDYEERHLSLSKLFLTVPLFLIWTNAHDGVLARYLPALLTGMQRHDVMIGSRYIPGGGVLHWPWSRRLMSGGINTLARLLLRIPARDTSGGYRCYRLSTLQRIGLTRFLSGGYSFQEELLYRCRRASCSIGETPILFENRHAGASKLSLKEAVRALAILGWIGVESLLGAGGTDSAK